MTAASLLIRHTLEVCPGLDEGGLDALAYLGPDLTVEEWGARLGVPAWVVLRAVTLLRIDLREAT